MLNKITATRLLGALIVALNLVHASGGIFLSGKVLSDWGYQTTSKTLNLARRDISEIEETLISGLGTLQYLFLNENKLKNLKRGTFKECSNLRVIRLDNNELTKLSDDGGLPNNMLFNGLNELQELWLNGNKLESIPAGIFESMDKLRYLFLHNNKLTAINDNVFGTEKLSNLVWLRLESNEIETIGTNSLQYMNKVQELSLSNNKLVSIPANTFRNLNNLYYLRLNGNGINVVEESTFTKYSFCETIEFINLENNPLTLTNNIENLCTGCKKCVVYYPSPPKN